MNDLHIEDFYKDIALTLKFLYQHFPRKMEIYIEDICGPDDIDEYGLHSERYLSCLAAIAWLGEENIIRYDSLTRDETFDQVGLTQASFLNLTHPCPDPFVDLQAKQTSTSADDLSSLNSLINYINEALKQASSEKLNASIRAFLTKNTLDKKSH